MTTNIMFNQNGTKRPTDVQLREVRILEKIVADVWVIESARESANSPSSEFRLRSKLPHPEGGRWYCIFTGPNTAIGDDQTLKQFFRQKLKEAVTIHLPLAA